MASTGFAEMAHNDPWLLTAKEAVVIDHIETKVIIIHTNLYSIVSVTVFPFQINMELI